MEIIPGEKARQLNARIYRRYLSAAALADPQVGPVFAQFDDITVKLKPTLWTWWDMPELDALFFGGRISSAPAYVLPQDI